MSPRPKVNRIISQPPVMEGFKPFGASCENFPVITLSFDEYESIKLADYFSYSHEECAGIMEISRPTFTRIYEGARKKIATAFAENSAIRITGGNVRFSKTWYKCGDCHSIFLQKDDTGKVHCPRCSSNEVFCLNHIGIDELVSYPDTDACNHKGKSGYCICEGCGLIISHYSGVECSDTLCPNCNIVMKKENASGNENNEIK